MTDFTKWSTNLKPKMPDAPPSNQTVMFVENEILRGENADVMVFLKEKDLLKEFHEWQQRRWKQETTV